MTYRLFTTFFEDKHERRRAEVDCCLAGNVSQFHHVHVLAENADQPDWYQGWWRNVDYRPTFGDVLRWIEEAAEPDDICVIANIDILIFQRALQQMERTLTSEVAICLSRWEMESMKLFDEPYTQDVWAIHGKPKPGIVSDFYFGVPGCDNRFTYELNQAGYQVLNPSREIRTYHVHQSRMRTATNTSQHRVPPPYLFIEPTMIGEQPELQHFTGMAAMRRAMRQRMRDRRRVAVET